MMHRWIGAHVGLSAAREPMRPGPQASGVKVIRRLGLRESGVGLLLSPRERLLSVRLAAAPRASSFLFAASSHSRQSSS